MADAEWLRRTAMYLGFHDMPSDLIGVAMTLRQSQPWTAMCVLRDYLRLPLIG